MYTESICWSAFRFHKVDMPYLLEQLGLADGSPGSTDGMWHTPNRCCFAPMEALVCLLGRLSYPNTWGQRAQLLGGRHPSAYSQMFIVVLQYLYDRFYPHVFEIGRFSSDALDFAAAIHAHGQLIENCIGFIDGTFRHCCRPDSDQRTIYSGYYKGHGFKFQSVVCPNGLLCDFWGPHCGRRADGHMFRASGFEARMQQLSQKVGKIMCVYGDPAYCRGKYISKGYLGACTPEQARWTVRMNAIRETVEWGFMLVVRDWAFIDYKKNLRLGLQPISMMYIVAVLLTNVKSCMMAEKYDGFGNEIANKFRVAPPSVHMYLYPDDDE